MPSAQSDTLFSETSEMLSPSKHILVSHCPLSIPPGGASSSPVLGLKLRLNTFLLILR